MVQGARLADDIVHLYIVVVVVLALVITIAVDINHKSRDLAFPLWMSSGGTSHFCC